MGSHFSDLTTRTMSLITMALLICFTTVLCQPLRMQAESFPCGSKNVMCERWGYDACLLRDGEHMCLPCSHEYLRSLCGTKEEVHGCNLFCLGQCILFILSGISSFVSHFHNRIIMLCTRVACLISCTIYTENSCCN